jgi:phospholipid/cholesterol/gamma-HCH transport system permease protein
MIIPKLNLILPIIKDMNGKLISWQEDRDQLVLRAEGEWTLHTVPQIEPLLQKVPHTKKIVWDLSGVTDFDSSGVLLFIEYLKRFKERGGVEVTGYSPEQKEMYDLLKAYMVEAIPPRKEGFLSELGKPQSRCCMTSRTLLHFWGTFSPLSSMP